MFDMIEIENDLLPKDRPRYLMGVGTPLDILGAIERGVDMFDCVMPTRAGRTAQAFTRRGAINLRNARFRDDPAPLDDECGCPACRLSRAYIHHLCKAGEILAATLLTQHNLWFYQDMMRGARRAIGEKKFAEYKKGFIVKYKGE
jgi:queuine tRNA-ribosyltransferase